MDFSETLKAFRTQCADVHITRKFRFRFHYFFWGGGNLGPFELRIFLIVKDKGIHVYICRNFFLQVMPFIKLFCIFNAYLAIHHVYLCQVIGECGVCELGHFFFHFNLQYNQSFYTLCIFFFMMVAVKCKFIM